MCCPKSLALPLGELGQLILSPQSSECLSVEQEKQYQPDLSARSLEGGQQKPTWAHSSKERH